MASVDYTNSSVVSESHGMGVETLVGTSEPGNFAVTMIYLVLLCATTLIGNIGNAMVIGAVVCDKRLQKESNIFIVNLAIADLCVTGESCFFYCFYCLVCLFAVVVFCCYFFLIFKMTVPPTATSYKLAFVVRKMARRLNNC